MSDLVSVQEGLPVRISGVSTSSGIPDNFADVNVGGSLQVAGQGVAGTPAGGVVSVQGVSGGTAIPASQSGTWNINVADFGGSAVVTGTGVSGAGIPRVTVSNDSNILATQSGAWTTGRTWTLASGTDSVSVVQSTSPWITKDQSDGPVSPGAVASFSQLIGGQYNSTQPTLTNTQQSAIQLDPLGNLRTTIPDRSVSGTLGSLGATITISGINGYSSGGLELDGSFSGTILVEGTVGGTQYANIGLFNVDAGYNTSLEFTGATVQSIYQLVGVGSYTTIKATVSAYTSGSLAATLNLSSGIDLLNVVSPYAPNFNVTAVGNVASGTADSGNGIKVSGIYNSSTPTFANGQRVDLQTDSSGNLKITGTVIANNASVSQVNNTTPSFATYVGGLATTSLQTWGNGDLAPLSIVNVGGYLRTTDAADGPVSPGTIALFSMLMGGQYSSTLPTLTTGQQSAIQIDSSGRQIISPLTSSSVITANQGTANTLANAWSEKLTDGTNGPVAVKPASTTATTSDPALVVTISPNSPSQSYSTGTGTISALNGNVIGSAGSGVVWDITGTWVGTLTTQATNGDGSWINVASLSNQSGLITNSTSINGTLELNAAGWVQVRLIATAWTSGTADVTWSSTPGSHLMIGYSSNGENFNTYTTLTDPNQNPLGYTAASTAATATQEALVVALSPNSSVPTGTNTIGAVNQGTSPWIVEGDSASGAAKAGNPVQIGGVFNTTQPTVTTGQTVEAQSTARGALIVATGVDNFNIDNITGTVSLPTGAATSTNQSTEITSLQLIDNSIGSATGGTAGSGSNLAGGIYNTTFPTLTNGEQAGVQVDSSGRLITSPTTLTQGSTTSGQGGNLAMGAVTTTPPTYVTAETDALSLTIDGDLRVADIVNTSSQYRAQSVTTTAAEALGGATILANRKLLHITPTNGTIYWGYSSAVTTTTGSPLFPNNTLWLSVGANVHVYVIAAATTDSRIGEVS